MNKSSWERLEARFGERGAFEFGFVVLFLQLTIRMIAGLQGAPGASKGEIDAIIAEFKSDKRGLPDYRQRNRWTGGRVRFAEAACVRAGRPSRVQRPFDS